MEKEFEHFKEKYNIFTQIKQCDRKLFHCHITENGNYLVSAYDGYDTYEEAKTECLKKLTEIVKNDNKTNKKR